MVYIHNKKNKSTIQARRKRNVTATRNNHIWRVKLYRDLLWDGRSANVLTIYDEFSKALLQVGTDTHLEDLGLMLLLNDLKKVRGVPELLLINESVKQLSLHVDIWCMKNKVRLVFEKNGPVASVPSSRAKLLGSLSVLNTFKTVREALIAAKQSGKNTSLSFLKKGRRW